MGTGTAWEDLRYTILSTSHLLTISAEITEISTAHCLHASYWRSQDWLHAS